MTSVSTEREPRVLVACIGSSLICDDRVGEAVYEELTRTRLPAGTRVVHLGVGGAELVDMLGAEDLLIVVDALRIGARPGTVHVLDWLEPEGTPALAHEGATPGLAHEGATPALAHDVGVPQALELTRLLYPERAPRRVVLVGVQGRCFDRLGAMSSEVAAAVDQATATVVDLAKRAKSASSRS